MFFVIKDQAQSCPWRGRLIHTFALVCFGAEERPRNATTRGPPEGKSPARVETRINTEPISLDAFFKVFKESMEKKDLELDQRFDELITRMDAIDQRFKNQDRCFQKQD